MGFAMNRKENWKKLAIIIAVFLGCYYLPIGTVRFDNAITESLHLVKWYAREHVLLCLMGAGMGKGPALALLLAGPALSLPNMLVIRSVMGTRKTIVFVLLVIMMATISGIIFGVISKG